MKDADQLAWAELYRYRANSEEQLRALAPEDTRWSLTSSQPPPALPRYRELQCGKQPSNAPYCAYCACSLFVRIHLQHCVCFLVTKPVQISVTNNILLGYIYSHYGENTSSQLWAGAFHFECISHFMSYLGTMNTGTFKKIIKNHRARNILSFI